MGQHLRNFFKIGNTAEDVSKPAIAAAPGEITGGGGRDARVIDQDTRLFYARDSQGPEDNVFDSGPIEETQHYNVRVDRRCCGAKMQQALHFATGAIAELLLFHTITSCSAAVRRNTMAVPIRPSPRNPIFITTPQTLYL